MAQNAARSLDTVTTVADLRARVKGWREEGLRIALVPTMGALHEGHLSLIRRAKMSVDKVVVSIFVNPTQFGPNEDFEKYPRQLDQDRFRVAMAGAALVYAPEVAEMYPPGFCTTIKLDGPTKGLCGDARPGHFDGVATVVTKLLLQCLPDVAVFGEKDYQQLQVIRRLARDLDIPVQIDGAPIVREMDGLAMSSRNAYLSDKERSVANLMYKALHKATLALHDGVPVADAIATAKAEILGVGFGRIDYLDLRDADTLALMDIFDRPARLFCAAHLGTTRLIDNIGLEPR
ncbi:pantoate--beta-alanine ligase [Novispirillum sp. DQ9]|uniref:pantoate--beta-alanine ligase n=1 Tax=Novispirillum sp. DQ9 TaxID=3398612 RepID=UPI003C7DCD5D